MTDGESKVGLSYFSENYNNISINQDGDTANKGVVSFPLVYRYSMNFLGQFLIPQFSYTFIPRKTAGDGAEVTTMQLGFLLGQNFASSFDWHIGPNYISRKYDGKGGSTVLNNGGGSATFGVPGKTVTTKALSLIVGLGWQMTTAQNLTFDVVLESALNNDALTQSIVLTYFYTFGGGYL